MHGNKKPTARPAGVKCRLCGRANGDLVQSSADAYQCDGSCALQQHKSERRPHSPPTNCPFPGCSFQGTVDEVDDHVVYMASIDGHVES